MANNKILSKNNLTKIIPRLKKSKKRIVFTNGCFDIIHYGHVAYLEKAKAKGDVLIVGVNSDSSVRKIKGKKRPVNSQSSRVKTIAAFECVDYAIIFNEDTPFNLIKRIVPDVLVKGADWKKGEIIGSDIVNKNKGKIFRIPYVKGFSTTALIKRIHQAYK